MINTRYEIIKKLGEGRSSVFLCKDIEVTDTNFAIKILPANADEHERNNFINEYFTLQRLEHPNIIKAFDFGTIFKTDNEENIEVGSTYIILEYFDGKELLSKNKIKTESDLKEIVKQISAALYYLHQSKYIYYDLKPENILVSFNESIPQVRLIDLGLAEYSPSPSDYEIKGTAHYIAPELLKKDEHNNSVDFYSLGIILYQIIYNRFPFTAKSELDIYKSAIEEKFNFPNSEHFSQELIKIVKKLLEKDIDKRYLSGLQVIKDLGFQLNIDLVKEFLPAKNYSCRDSVIQQLSEYIQESESTEVYTIKGFEGVGKSSLLYKIHEHFREAVLISDVKGKSVDELVRYLLRKIIFSKSVYPNLSEQNKQSLLNQLNLDPKDIIAEFRNLVAVISSKCSFILLIDDFNSYDQLLGNLLMDIIPILQVNNIKVIVSESSEHEVLSSGINSLKEIILGAFTEAELEKFLNESYSSDLPRDKIKNLILKNADLIPGNIKSFIKDLILFGIMKFSEDGMTLADQENKISSLTEAHYAVYDLRLSNLTKKELITTQIISAFETYIDSNTLSTILGFGKVDIEKMINNLKFNNVIQNSVSGQALIFTSEAIKNYIYASVENKKKLHQGIAAKISKNFPSFNRLELARQYELAGEYELCYNKSMDEIKEAESNSTFSYIQKILSHLITLPLREELIKSAKIKLSEISLKLGDVQSSLALIKELKNDFPKTNIDDRLFFLEGSALIASGDYKTGKRVLSELLKKINDLGERNALKVELAYADFELKRFNEANALCDELLKDRNLSSELRGRCYNLKGMINIYQSNDLDSALGNFQNAMENFSEVGQLNRVSGTKVNIGNIYNIKGNYTKAEEYLQSASKINQSIGNLDQEGLLMQNMGAFYFNRSNFEAARKSYQKAHNIFLSIGNELSRAIVLWDLGEIYTSYCEYDYALNSLNEAESIFIRMNNYTELLDDLFMKGKLFYKIGYFQKLEEVIDNFHSNLVKYNLFQSHEVFEKLLVQFNSAGRKESLSITELQFIRDEMIQRKDIPNYIEVINLITQFYINQKSYQSAISELNQHEFIELCSQNSILEAEREYFLGLVSKNLKSEELLPPLVYFEKAYDLIKDEYINELTWKVLFEISDLYIERGNLHKAKFFVTYTRELIYFIAEKIKSPQLRATYLRNSERMNTLKKLESFYPSN